MPQTTAQTLMDVTKLVALTEQKPNQIMVRIGTMKSFGLRVVDRNEDDLRDLHSVAAEANGMTVRDDGTNGILIFRGLGQMRLDGLLLDLKRAGYGLLDGYEQRPAQGLGYVVLKFVSNSDDLLDGDPREEIRLFLTLGTFKGVKVHANPSFAGGRKDSICCFAKPPKPGSKKDPDFLNFDGFAYRQREG